MFDQLKISFSSLKVDVVEEGFEMQIVFFIFEQIFVDEGDII